MAIVFDRDFGRVWSDGATPYVFSSIVRVPQLRELDELAGKQLEMIRDLKRVFGDVYSIIDLRLCPVVPEQIVRHYIGKIVPGQFKAGVKHKAFVVPEEEKSQEVFAHTITQIVGLSISMHSSFEDALNEINRKRTQEKSVLKRKPVLRFFQTLFAKP
jgi:hypothetical protein